MNTNIHVNPEINISFRNGFLDGLKRQLEEIARENGDYIDSNDIDIFDEFNNR